MADWLSKVKPPVGRRAWDQNLLSVIKTGFTISQYNFDLPWITKENFPEPYNGAKRNGEGPDGVLSRNSKTLWYGRLKLWI